MLLTQREHKPIPISIVVPIGSFVSLSLFTRHSRLQRAIDMLLNNKCFVSFDRVTDLNYIVIKKWELL